MTGNLSFIFQFSVGKAFAAGQFRKWKVTNRKLAVGSMDNGQWLMANSIGGSS